jgi:hypothetical protein
MAAPIPANVALVASIERNFESKDLDYKETLIWSSDDKKQKCELVKDVLAMANTEGGQIVIGVSELGDGFLLTGVSEECAASVETSELCRFVQIYADPPINLHVQKVIHKDLLFIVIEVPRFTDTPHLCQKDYPGVLQDRTLYVRTDNNESAPVRSSADFRSVIERAVRNKSEDLLSAMRAILTDQPERRPDESAEALAHYETQVHSARESFAAWNPRKSKGYTYFYETVFRPEVFEQYRYTNRELENAAFSATVSYTGWPFLFAHFSRRDWMTELDEGIECKIATEDFASNDIIDFWRLYADGLFYKKQLPGHASSTPPVLYGSGIVHQFAEAIDCMCRLYTPLCSTAERVELRFTVTGTRNRIHIWDTSTPRGADQASRPSVFVSATHSLADWKAGLHDHVFEMTRDLLKHFRFRLEDETKVRFISDKLFSRRF